MPKKEAPDWGYWTVMLALIQLALEVSSRFSAR